MNLIRKYSHLACLTSAFAIFPVSAANEFGLGMGFNPEGREEATGDSFFYYGYSRPVTDSLELGLKLQARQYGATLSENSHYQDKVFDVLLSAKYYASERFFLGAHFGPTLKVRSTIVWNAGYNKSRETFFEFAYIPKPILGVRLWINKETRSAVEASLSMSNKGEDILASMGFQF